jgi:hypothetical protein
MINNQVNNLRDLILTGGRARETGIQHYIQDLSKSDSKLNLDTLDEMVTSLENMYIYNKNACDNSNSSRSEYDSAEIECKNNSNYEDLFKKLYSNAKSKWKSTSCYKNSNGQCINFDELIKHWAPKLYSDFKSSMGGSSGIDFLLSHYSSKY